MKYTLVHINSRRKVNFKYDYYKDNLSNKNWKFSGTIGDGALYAIEIPFKKYFFIKNEWLNEQNGEHKLDKNIKIPLKIETIE